MLKLIRGVTQSIAITITDDDSNIYKLQSGEVLRLSVIRKIQIMMLKRKLVAKHYMVILML